MHKSQLTSLCLIGLLTGVLVRSFYYWPLSATLVAVSFFVVMACWKNQYIRASAYYLIAASLGACYFVFRIYTITPDTAAYYNDSNIEIIGRVQTEVERRTGGQTVVLSVKSAPTLDNKALTGKVLLKLPLYPVMLYGDIIRVKCNLKKPEPVEGFAYDRYLAVADIYSICDWPKIIERRHGEGSFIIDAIYKAKNVFITRLNEIFSEPRASLLAGLLIGSRQGLPASLHEDFKRTGLSHITAISGYNITIIVSGILGATKKYIGRKRGFWLVIGVLVLFVILTGAQASVVRAAVMGVVVLLARQIGRLSSVHNIIALTAGIMVLINPLVLAFDIGFQLSFLATIGLVYVSPMLERYVKWLPEAFAIRESVNSTLSATIATLPLMIYYFGRVSIISPLANLMILPVIPIVMATGFATVLTGITLPQIGQWISVLSWFGLEYMLCITRFLAQYHYASINNIHIMPIIVWVLYGVMLFYIVNTHIRSQWRRLP